MLALLEAHHILHVSRIRVKLSSRYWHITLYLLVHYSKKTVEIFRFWL